MFLKQIQDNNGSLAKLVWVRLSPILPECCSIQKKMQNNLYDCIYDVTYTFTIPDLGVLSIPHSI